MVSTRLDPFHCTKTIGNFHGGYQAELKKSLPSPKYFFYKISQEFEEIV